MKLYITTTGPFPHGGANVNRIICYAKGLKMMGCQCEILTTSHRDLSEETSDVPYRRLGKGINTDNFLKRLFFYISNTYEIRKYLFEETSKDDVVLMYHNDIIQDLLILPIRKRCKVVRELCELPEIDNRKSSRFFRWIQLHCFFKKFNGFIAISTTLSDLAKRYKHENAAIIKVPIMVDVDRYSTDLRLLDTDKIKSSCNYIFHSGSVGELKDGFLGMLEALSKVNRKGNNLHLYCTGSIDKNSQSYQLIESLDLIENVHFIGYLEDEELKRYQANSFLFVINKLDTLQNRYCFATKLGEYLATKKPVITTNIGESNYYLTNNQNAIIVDAGNYDEIANKIIEIINNQVMGAEIGYKGYVTAVDHFRYEVHSSNLFHFIKTLPSL